jgi:CheY-like chemotaxis protein
MLPGTPVVMCLVSDVLEWSTMLDAGCQNRLTVLLADEPDGSSATVRQLLEPQGVQTLVARTGREALEMVRSQPVHVVVLDVQMPQLGGLQALRLMREVVKTPPPAILLADRLSNNLLREALTMDVFSVMPKPVELNRLLDSIARVIKRHYESRWPVSGN